MQVCLVLGVFDTETLLMISYTVDGDLGPFE